MKRIRFTLFAIVVSFAFAGAAQATHLACYVDTPAYDLFNPNACFAIGTSSSVAVFQVQNFNPAYYDIYWSEPSCATNSTTCVVSIRPGQQRTVSAFLVFRPEPEGAFTYTATAYYEGPW